MIERDWFHPDISVIHSTYVDSGNSNHHIRIAGEFNYSGSIENTRALMRLVLAEISPQPIHLLHRSVLALDPCHDMGLSFPASWL